MEEFFIAEALTLLLTIVTVVVLLYMLLRKPAGIPPGPAFTVPVLGDLPLLAKGDIKGTFRQLRQKHGDIYSFYMGRQLAIIVNGYDLIYKVVVEKGIHYCGRPQGYLTEIFSKGRGLNFATGMVWKKQRQFTNKILQQLGVMKQSFEGNIITEVESFIDVLNEQKGQPFDIHSSIHASVANVIFTVIVGKRHEYQDPFFQDLLKRIETQTRNIAQISVLLNCVPILRHIPGDPFQMKALRNNYLMFEKEFDEHFLKQDNDGKTVEYNFIHLYKEKIKQKEALEDTHIFPADQLKTIVWDLLVAGSETTAVNLRWAILYLLNFQDIQQRLQRDIDYVIPADKTPNLSDKIKLPYVEAFILEVIRCADIAPIVPRSDFDNKDSYFEGFFVPKESTIMYNLDSIFMDPNIFQHPDQFNPGRFLDNNGNCVKPKEFIPFSAGRRMCVGEQLANMEMFLFLTSLLKTFTFLPDESGNVPSIDGIYKGSVFSPKEFSVRCIRRVR